MAEQDHREGYLRRFESALGNSHVLVEAHKTQTP